MRKILITSDCLSNHITCNTLSILGFFFLFPTGDNLSQPSLRSLTTSFKKELDRNKDGYLDSVRLFVHSFFIPFVFINLTF